MRVRPGEAQGLNLGGQGQREHTEEDPSGADSDATVPGTMGSKPTDSSVSSSTAEEAEAAPEPKLRAAMVGLSMKKAAYLEAADGAADRDVGVGVGGAQNESESSPQTTCWTQHVSRHVGLQCRYEQPRDAKPRTRQLSIERRLNMHRGILDCSAGTSNRLSNGTLNPGLLGLELCMDCACIQM
jgi:hypothetical protein